MSKSGYFVVSLFFGFAVYASAQKAATVSDSFRALLDRHSAATAGPTGNEISEMGRRIKAAPAQELADALPLFFAAALSGTDDTVKIYGAMALLSVSGRYDCGDELLRARIGEVAGLLALDNPGLQRLGSGILGALFATATTPPAEVFPVLKAFLKRTDRDPAAQNAAAGILMKYDSQDPEAVQAVAAHLLRPLSPIEREDALRAVSIPGLKDIKIIDAVAKFVDDPLPQTRILAINALSKIGPQAVAQAEPALVEAVNRADQPDNVKTAARKALSEIGRTGQ